MSEPAQFVGNVPDGFAALAFLIAGGYALSAYMLTRLGAQLDRRFDRLETGIRDLRRGLTEDFRAQRAEVVASLPNIASTPETAALCSRQDQQDVFNRGTASVILEMRAALERIEQRLSA